MSNKQVITPQQEYYQVMTNLDEKIKERTYKAGITDGLNKTKDLLLGSISGIQFRKMNATDELGQLGGYLKELEKEQEKVSSLEDKAEKEVNQLAKKIKSKKDQYAKTFALFQGTAGSVSITMDKSGKNIIINDKDKGEAITLRNEASDLEYQIEQLTDRLDEKIIEVNEQKEKVNFINIDLKRLKEKDDIIQKQIRSVEAKIKARQLLQKDCKLEGESRKKINDIERKHAEAELKDLKEELSSVAKEKSRLQLFVKQEQSQLSILNKEYNQISQSLSKLKGQTQKLNSKSLQAIKQIETYRDELAILQEQFTVLQSKKQAKQREKEEYHIQENNYEDLKTLVINKQKIIKQLLQSYDIAVKDKSADLNQIKGQINFYEKEVKIIDQQIIKETAEIEKNKEMFKKKLDPVKAEKFNQFLFNKGQKNEPKKK